MSNSGKPGHYQDEKGDWHADRRKSEDRRNRAGKGEEGEKRGSLRRKADRQRVDREHKEMIRDALDSLGSEEEED